MNYPGLEQFWAVQSERIETRAKLNGLQWIIIIILTIVASLYVTPIGGSFVAYASYRIILHWVVKANKSIKTKGEYFTLTKEAGMDVAWLISMSLEDLNLMDISSLPRATKARDALRKILEQRQKDILELEELDPLNQDVIDTKKSYMGCFQELEQINKVLDPRLEDLQKSERENLEQLKSQEKQNKLEAADKKEELKQQLEALEKAYNVGILSKSEYDSKKSSINSSMKDI